MIQDNRTTIARRLTGIAAMAVLVAACSGSSDGAETDTSTPDTGAPIVPVSEPLATVAPPVTEPPAAEPAIDPAEIPEVPCEEYVDEVGYPLKPCDSGTLVGSLQSDLQSLFPTIAIDGLYGGQTFGFIEQIQTATGDEVTGLVSEELAGRIAAAESIDALASGEAPAATDAAEVDTEADIESEDVGDVTEELCTELIGDASNPNFTPETLESCSALGIDIVGEA